MKKSERAVVAAGHEAVAQAAAVVLKAGGNAFDAVVAAGLAGTVAEPMLTSLGGGGFLLARTGNGEEVFFDFFVNAPGLGLDASMLEPHFYPINVAFGGSDQEFNIGLGSVAVPGTLKGLLHVHEWLGRMSLAEVIEPAAGLADGHALNAFQADFIRLLRPILTMSETGRNLYEPEGELLQAGEILAVPELAAFLRHLAEDKGRDFYQGAIARRIEQDMRNGDGLLSAEDLAAYRVIERNPLHIPYHGHTLLTSPDLGGSLIGLSLLLLEKTGNTGGPVRQWGGPEHLCRTLGLMQEVERLRKKGITTPQALADFAAGREAGASTERIRQFSRGTTHISVADSKGNIASMTCSNGEGSGYFAPGTGIMLNNMMGEDDLHPEGFHAEPPGKRVGSMMSPSALLQDNEVRLVFGSGGSKRIRTALTQVLAQILDFKRDLSEAVQAPRMHWDDDEGVLQIEPGFDPQAVAAVQEHVPVNLWDDLNVYFGGVHAVIPGVGGAGDPRRGGTVTVVDL